MSSLRNFLRLGNTASYEARRSRAANQSLPSREWRIEARVSMWNFTCLMNLLIAQRSRTDSVPFLCLGIRKEWENLLCGPQGEERLKEHRLMRWVSEKGQVRRVGRKGGNELDQISQTHST